MDNDIGKTNPIPIPQIKKCKSEGDSLLSWKNSRMTDIIKQLNNTNSGEQFDKKYFLKKSSTYDDVNSYEKN